MFDRDSFKDLTNSTDEELDKFFEFMTQAVDNTDTDQGE